MDGLAYSSFKNKHAGQKIIVCGCGTSADLIKKVAHNNPVIIGVNDFGRLMTPSYLVVLNDKMGFNEDRWSWIKDSEAPVCFTQIPSLNTKSKKCVLKLGRYGGYDFDSDRVDYSTNSPYVACIIAAYMGATSIGVLGVDFTNDHFFGSTGEHNLTKKLGQIKIEYAQLDKHLKSKGRSIVNLSPISRVGMTYCDIEKFL